MNNLLSQHLNLLTTPATTAGASTSSAGASVTLQVCFPIRRPAALQLHDLLRSQLATLQERLQLNVLHQTQAFAQIQQCRSTDKKMMAQVSGRPYDEHGTMRTETDHM